MKVILTQDVYKLGELGTIQNVKDGYARNYLIPQGLAEMATPGTIKQVNQRQEAENRRIAMLEEEMRELSIRIEAAQITIEARVGEQGRLYGSVTAADIAVRLSEEMGEEIDRRKVELDQPIREIGEFEVPVRLVGRLIPTATVIVYDPEAPEVEEDEETEDNVLEEVIVEAVEESVDMTAAADEDSDEIVEIEAEATDEAVDPEVEESDD